MDVVIKPIQGALKDVLQIQKAVSPSCGGQIQFRIMRVMSSGPGVNDQVDHTLIICGKIQIRHFFYDLNCFQPGIIYDSEYGQPGTINFYCPVWNHGL